MNKLTMSFVFYIFLPVAMAAEVDSVGANSDAYQDLVIDTRGGLEVTTTDGEFSLQLGGRILADVAVYDEDMNALGNGSELRDLRLDLEGRLYADFIYELSVDFSDGEADVKDAWFAYDANYPWRYAVGHFKEPFSLEEMTSKRYLTFMERALPNVFAPGRSMGVGAHWSGEQVTFAGGLFGDDYNDDTDDEGDEGWGVTSRITYAPKAEERSALHLGMAASYRKLDDEETVRFDSRPESHLTDIRYLDTGKLEQSDSTTLVGVEGAWVSGPFSMQGEWMQAKIARDADKDPTFEGWYLQASWFLTGESRRYKQSSAKFGRIRPLSDHGAVEVAARFSSVDLNDGEIEGGSSDIITLGLNWYINRQIRLMANTIFIDNDRFADADGDVEGEDEPSILQLRAQVDF
ncbi:OprO/OprP family phosphate-selective porin [Candidatus Thiodiazotropha sp. CDECU1]|uniref:OprO/OprP family phosphate-selective porin n=1 Tax=Candidatus Thiodiazotropha sp. CDECU1 TaxID=3065865 RepID=UPI0029315DA1|nr:porin [Candidatus Thiodiazotropha sp. CDECU1]